MTVTAARFVLASGSPRRRELLEDRLGIDVVVRPVDIDESPAEGESGLALVRRLAREKARAVAVEPTDVVLAADTVVVRDGVVLGKPTDPDDARAMLASLSDRAHDAITGVCLRRGDAEVVTSVTTTVTVRELSAAWIDWYVDTGEPMDKAGAYGIQGRAGLFVTHVDGSDTNVIGLPLGALIDLAAQLEVDLRDHVR